MREAAAAVERVGRGVSRVAATGTTTARTPSSPVVPGIARDDDELVDRVAFDDEALLAREHDVVAVGRAPSPSYVGRVERPVRSDDRERARQLAGGDGAEPARTLLGGAGLAHGGNELRDGREQRARAR